MCHLLMSEDPCQNEISFLIRKLILLAKGLSSGEYLCQGPIMLVGSLLVHLHKDYFILGFPRDVFQVSGDLVSLVLLVASGQAL